MKSLGENQGFSHVTIVWQKVVPVPEDDNYCLISMQLLSYLTVDFANLGGA